MNRLKDNFYLLCADFVNTGAEMKEMALNPTKKQKIAVGVALSLVLIFFTLSMSLGAGGDVFSAIGDFASTVYKKLLLISTPIAVVVFVGALLYSQLCFNPQKVSQVIGICKRVLIVWIVIICASTIFTFIWNSLSKNQSADIPTFSK